MKYTFTLLLAALSLISFGQSTVSAGLTYGLSTNTFGGESSDFSNYRNGDRFGAFLNFAPIPIFSIEPQFIVSKKGANLELKEGKNSVRITYAELPILFNLRIPLGEVVFPKVFAGPYFATRISSQQEVNPLDENVPLDQMDFKNGDMGFTFGLGVDFVAERIYFSLNARSDYGTTRVGSSEYTPDLKNRSYSINAALGFVLTR